MIYVESFLDKVGSKDTDVLSQQPLSAAKALAWIALEAKDEPIKLKKGQPVYGHAIAYDRAVKGHFDLQVRLRTSGIDTKHLSTFVLANLVASMKSTAEFTSCTFEFNPEGHTSIQGGSSINPNSPNHWHPIEDQVARYVRQRAAEL